MASEVYRLYKSPTHAAQQKQKIPSDFHTAKWGWGRAVAVMVGISSAFWLGLVMIIVL